MNKIWIPILVLSFAFMISNALSADNATSAIVNYRVYVGNSTQCYSRYTCGGESNRTICNITAEGSCHMCSLEGEVFNGTALLGEAPFCERFVNIDNMEHKNFNLLVKIVPEPNHDCFGNSTPYNCDILDWNPVVRLRVPKPNLTATDYIEIDTSKCWNWWNNSDPAIQTQQASYCPIGSIYITSDVDVQRIEWDWSNRTGADIDYEVIFLGYSTSTVNIEQRISPSLATVMQAVASLVSINIDIWKVLYYLFLIVAIIVAVVFIVGFLPLSIKWILKKITE